MFMQYRSLFWVAFTAGIAVLSLAPARAQNVSVGVRAAMSLNATVGLDADTRELLEKLPQDIRQQTILLLQQALPLIDHSVTDYLNQVNTILKKQIDSIPCKVAASTQSFFEVFKKEVLGKDENPVESLQAQWETYQTMFTSATAPADFSTKYAVFLVQESVDVCQLETVPEALQKIAVLGEKARLNYAVWHKMEDRNCLNADACYTAMSEEIKSLLATADIRDIQAIQGRQRYEAAVRPDPPGGWWWSKKFSQTPYEAQLSTFLEIENGITVHRTYREATAQKMIGDVDASLTAWEGTSQAARAELSDRDIDANNRAKKSAGDVVAQRQAMANAIKVALDESSTVSDRATAQSDRLNRVMNALVGTGAEADKNIVLIQKRHQDQIDRQTNHAPH